MSLLHVALHQPKNSRRAGLRVATQLRQGASCQHPSFKQENGLVGGNFSTQQVVRDGHNGDIALLQSYH